MTLMVTKGTIKWWSIIENCCANLFYFLSYWPMSHSLFHNHFIQTVKWNDQTFIYQSKGAQSKQCPWQIYSSLKSATYFQILIISLIILSKCSFKHPKQIRTKRKTFQNNRLGGRDALFFCFQFFYNILKSGQEVI